MLDERKHRMKHSTTDTYPFNKVGYVLLDEEPGITERFVTLGWLDRESMRIGGR
jgi:hypothetical protein